MSSRTVMIRNAVYEALRKEKRREESFSGVIDRLLARRHPLEVLNGLWAGPPSRARRRGAPPSPRRGAGGTL